jgi:nucleotide-binding universal stress UspA family protein
MTNMTNPPKFDIFLSHNSKDKGTVRSLARALESQGIRVWLDEDQLIPGKPWQEALEKVLQDVNSAAILIGNDGLGPWESPEMRVCLLEFVGSSGFRLISFSN